VTTIRSVRFREEELEQLHRLEEERNTTVNGLVRLAVRALCGLPNPSWADQLLDEERSKRTPNGGIAA
jgi:hypothetical protein